MINEKNKEHGVIGNINASSISGEIRSASITGIVSENGTVGTAMIGGIIIERPTAPYYEGDYEVAPTVEEQILSTKEKTMRDDLVIQEIPVYKTTNTSGGYTVIIGG